MSYGDSAAGGSARVTAVDRPVEGEDASLVAAIAAGTEVQNDLYLKYRRPLMQIFLQRRIERDTAQDLLQRTFLQAIKKIRTEGLDDPGNLGGYLYRTACNLAVMYWRGELARRRTSATEPLTRLRDGALSLDERIDRQLLAECVRKLMVELPRERDRDVLQRLYLDEEPKAQVRESMQLTDLQFNQVLFRARQRFGEILRRHGFDTHR
ncbi:MAG TPA: sigma-70 family RNA polymerase sigma factor [Steroidobacteraceae bacterium]|nr:sigma-70 family RNA polymerase sigma factor [Steroidobacteraceae bacterium]